MSRAFVKEDDGDRPEAPLPDRPISQHPNLVTPQGLEKLKAKVLALKEERQSLSRQADMFAQGRLPEVARDLRYFEHRLSSAVVVDPARLSGEKIQIGCLVELEDEQGNTYHYRIVGEDEADPAKGLISWVSPLGTALMGQPEDEEVLWRRPDGPRRLIILSIDPRPADT
ncbi:transcription elongation factor GreAB [Pistricoccus aurantiacus]|uniref:Transcription elongation factor GreAB n=1 Tax=Pistricoccus aurantiacus TaxID=1883414 RepID=A0A5B8SQE8_9GAMM|nr:GreA/GreB family elongation factor [Pistricoccus aurantiacus]QEA38444.1 transcription elongation factor GreAB [Pistricoccus aurantiacus]